MADIKIKREDIKSEALKRRCQENNEQCKSSTEDSEIYDVDDDDFKE